MEAMRKLNDREKLILNLRFFDGRTQMEVAEEIGDFPGPGFTFRKDCTNAYEKNIYNRYFLSVKGVNLYL